MSIVALICIFVAKILVDNDIFSVRTPVIPSTSPFCLKVESWLKLHGIKYMVGLAFYFICTVCDYFCWVGLVGIETHYVQIKFFAQLRVRSLEAVCACVVASAVCACAVASAVCSCVVASVYTVQYCK